MADMTATTMANWIAEVWSKKATITYRSNVVLWGLIDRSWEPELGVARGDIVNIPAFTQNSSATKRTTFGTGAALTFTATTESQVQLAVNTMAYKAYRVPAELSLQRFAEYEALLTRGIGEAVALQADADVGADDTNGIDGFTTNVVGSDGVDTTEDNLQTCETNLDNVNAPMADRFLVVSPATKQSLMKIESFRNQLYAAAVGQLRAPIGPGFVGQLLSFGVYMSNNLEAGTLGKKNGAFQREAIAGAMQKELSVHVDLNIEDGLFTQVAGWASYGLKMVKETFGNELDGK